MLGFEIYPRTVCLVCAIICAAGTPLLAQTSTGRIAGTVADSSGAAVPNAAVTITDTQRGTTRNLTTDGVGAYNAPNLLPSHYSVKVESQGFRTVERTGITLEVNSQLQIDMVLQPGEQTQTISVNAEAPLLETTNATLGGTIENKVINDLPLNGRNFENLLELRPGVAKAPGGMNFNTSSDGGRPHSDQYLIDGVYVDDPWNAKSIMNGTMAAGDAGTILPIEAIDEFKNQQNPQAEYGWKNGSVTVVGIKSGTNSYHGSAYAYGRDGSWDAQNFFFTGQPKADVGVEQFGASLGAPIVKDRLFYFVNYEQQMYNVGVQAGHTVPITSTDPSATGSALSLIGACKAALASSTGVAPVSAQIAGLSSTCAPTSIYPGLFPNNNSNSTVFSTVLPNNNTIYSGVGKVDYHINEKHSISGSYFRSQGAGTFDQNPASTTSVTRELNQTALAQYGSASWTWVPNSRWVNSANLGYAYYKQTFISVDGNQNPADYYGMYHLYTGQTNPVAYGFPQIAINPFNAGLNGTGFPNLQGPDHTINFSDTVSYQLGSHSLTFGGQMLFNDANSFAPGQIKGNLTFNSLTNFFQGVMSRAAVNVGNYVREYTNQGYAGFIQDEWRVRPGLTLNIGLRYERVTAVNEANNLLGNFLPGQGIVQVGQQISSPYNSDGNNFAPRVGIAWSIDSKTVLRVGGSVAYDEGSFDSLMSVANSFGLNAIPTGLPLYYGGSSTPVTIPGGKITAAGYSYTGSSVNLINANWLNNGPNTPLFPSFAACGDGSTKAANGSIPGQCSILAVNPNLRTPYVTTWTVDLQRALTSGLSLDVGYIGNHGTKLWGITDINQPAPGAGWTASVLAACEAAPTAANCSPSSAAEQAARPFANIPYLKNINYMSNSNWSNYDGLQVALTQRSWRGLSYVAGYTWSHALGLSSDNWRFIFPINSYDTRSLYGNTLFDVTHRFTYSVTYALPGKRSPLQMLEGWSVNSIVRVQTGMPWGVNDTTTDFSGTGEFGNTGQTTGEKWDYFGNYSDFNFSRNLLNTNNGAGGIPYYPGTSNASCLAKAQSVGPAAVASLTRLGCYANGGSVMIPAPYGSYGTMGPQTFRGPGFSNVDFSVTKSWNFTEKMHAQFRAEFFNIFNHANFANVNGTPTVSGAKPSTDPSAAAGNGFGVLAETPDVAASNPVLGSGGPRAIQLGLRILF